MYAVISDNEIVGSVSLYVLGDGAIGAGPTILYKYRKMGYGYTAVKLALECAKQKGYTKAVSQVCKDNIASLLLHKKLDFAIISEGISRRGNEVYNLVKQI